MSVIASWFAWSMASFFYAYQYILRVMPNIMIEDLMNQFNINASSFGQFSGFYYIGYSLFHVPIGILLDRYSPKYVMSVCILLTVVGLTPILFSDTWVFPVLGRFLIGAGSSAAILGTFKIIRIAFEEKLFTRMLSFSVTIGLIGAIYGGGPVSLMCRTIGYKSVVLTFIVIGLVFAVLTYIAVPYIQPQKPTNVVVNLKEVFSNGYVMALCFLSGLMVGPLEGFADVWGTEFLRLVYGYSIEQASYLPSLVFIGMCFGAPLLSLVAEKTGDYIGTVIGAGVTMCLVFTLLVFSLLELCWIKVGFVLVGVCSAYQIIAIYKASTYVSEGSVGLTTAIANMIIMSFGYAFHSVIGYVIESCGGIKSLSAYTYGVAVIPLTLALGVVGFSFILYKEKSSLLKA